MTGIAFFPAHGTAFPEPLPRYEIPDETKPDYDEGQTRAGNTRTAENADAHDSSNDKKYWMPDKMCKVCYECGTPFSMFKRRHHCRLCGQVFCNNCSGRNIGAARTCNFCYALYQHPKENQTMRQRLQQKQMDDPANVGQSQAEDLSVDENIPLSLQIKLGMVSVSAPVATTAGVEEKEALKRGQRERPELVEGFHLEDHSSRRDDRESRKTALQKAAREHLHQMVVQLVERSVLISPNQKGQWAETVVSLATRACKSVMPQVPLGDMMDIRPYVNVKAIPGGSVDQSAYVAGVVARKQVAHKNMLRQIKDPKLMLLSGSLQFQRVEQQITSLDTLLEQEKKYLEILVQKIANLKPDLLLVGKSVSRQAQELLQQHKIVLVMNVKQSLMERIARRTGAMIIASIDHVDKVGSEAIGHCTNFSVRAFQGDHTVGDAKANKAFTTQARQQKGSYAGSTRLEAKELPKSTGEKQRPRQRLKIKSDGDLIETHYMFLEGCPEVLGCTLFLRGGSHDQLMELKQITRFATFIAYNLKLETAFLLDTYAYLPSILPKSEGKTQRILSCSLGVDFGPPPEPHGVSYYDSPGLQQQQLIMLQQQQQQQQRRSLSPEEHQRIYVAECWMARKHAVDHEEELVSSASLRSLQCRKEVKGICYYSPEDCTLGQFLIGQCFNLTLRCHSTKCKRHILDHTLYYLHNNGRLTITVDQIPYALPKPTGLPDDGEESNMDSNKQILMWRRSTKTRKCTPCVIMSQKTWQYSFGKYLETFFHSNLSVMSDAENPMNKDECEQIFGFRNLVAVFKFEFHKPYSLSSSYVGAYNPSVYDDEKTRQIQRVKDIAAELQHAFLLKVSELEDNANRGVHSERSGHLKMIMDELKLLKEDMRDKLSPIIRVAQGGTGTLGVVPEVFPHALRRDMYIHAKHWEEKLNDVVNLLRSATWGGEKDMDGGSEDNSQSTFSSGTSSTDLGRNNDSMSASAALHQADVTSAHGGKGDLTKEGVTVGVVAGKQSTASTTASDRKANSKKPSNVGGPSQPHSAMYQSGSHQRNVSSSHTTSGWRSTISSMWHKDADKPDVKERGLPQQQLFEGHPGLTPPPTLKGDVLLVHEDQPATVIAYSLNSEDYRNSLAQYLAAEDLPQYNSGGVKQEQHSDGNNNTKGGSDAAGVLQDVTSGSEAAPDSAATTGTELFGTNDTLVSLKPVMREQLETTLLSQMKTHIKHQFVDEDDGNHCKFVCHTFWATQFHAMREVLCGVHGSGDHQQEYTRSLSLAEHWDATGGKSGATFSRTLDQRFVVKHITKTELQMFLDCAPAYFEYMSKVLFHGRVSVLVKVLGVHQIYFANRETGRRQTDQVVVMENLFHKCKISRTFDLKGAHRQVQRKDMNPKDDRVLLDDNLMEYTDGHPLPLREANKRPFQDSYLNDTLFLSIINVVDYSILVGIDEENKRLVVGIIDYMRQYDLIKKMESVGKSVGMIAGHAEPTVIQPSHYKNRFQMAMERYFSTVPDKFSCFDL